MDFNNEESANSFSGFSADTRRILGQCPICQQKRDTVEARVLEEEDGARLIHIRCRACGNSMVNLLVQDPNGLSAMGVLTDLSADDMVRAQHRSPVTEDDVLNTFARLKEEPFITSL